MPLIVADTNVLISSLIGKKLRPFLTALKEGNFELLFSEETFEEIISVLQRPKFRRYFTDDDRNEFVELMNLQSYFTEISMHITDCRDSKDNIFLECAVAGDADYIISGDPDLLELNPYKNIPIISPADFLKYL